MSTPIEQNTTDLQNILNAVNELPDAGGGGGECNCSEWEIINEIVTTEEVTGVTISTDSDGNAFDLLEGKAYIMPPGDVYLPDAPWYLYSSPSSENYALYTTSSVKFVMFEYSKLDLLIRVSAKNMLSGKGEFGLSKAGAAIFNRFRLLNWSGVNIPVGTTIRLIGRRA